MTRGEKAMRRTIIALASIGMLAAGGAHAQGPSIDPEAERLLRKASTHLAGLAAFRVEAEILEDGWTDTGQLVESGRAAELVVRRPDRMWVETVSETTRKQYWLDGSTVTLFDVLYGTYARAPAPGGIDATLETLADRFGVIIPLADVAMSDLYGALMPSVESAAYLGVRHVGGKEVHHLAFRQADIDWQLWVATGPQPLPHKLSITYKDEEGSPRFTAAFSGWDTTGAFPDSMFEFEPGPGTSEMEFIEIGGQRD